ncbi:MAG: hypothetical protein JNN07_17075 [Verrucomicrobiales bacterium]|nr:hypothetical protein [Verrucomicrobiales bacterium]
MQPRSASPTSRMSWARALMAGLGLSLLWSNAQDNRGLVVHPTSENPAPRFSGLSAGDVAELFRVGHRIIVAGENLKNSSRDPLIRQMGGEIAQRYRQVQSNLGMLTNRIAQAAVAARDSVARSDDAGSRGSGLNADPSAPMAGLTLTLPPALAGELSVSASESAFGVNDSAASTGLVRRGPSSFEPAARRDRMGLTCLKTALAAAIKAYGNPGLRKLDPALGRFADVQVEQLSRDQHRVEASLREDEVFGRSGEREGSGGLLDQPY